MGVAPSSIQESDVAMELPLPQRQSQQQRANEDGNDKIAKNDHGQAANGDTTTRPQQQQERLPLLDNREYLNQKEKELMHRYNVQLSALWEQQQQISMDETLTATGTGSTSTSDLNAANSKHKSGATSDSARSAPTEGRDEGSGRRRSSTANVDYTREQSDSSRANLRADGYLVKQRNTEPPIEYDALCALDQVSSADRVVSKNEAEANGAKRSGERVASSKGSRQAMDWNVFTSKRTFGTTAPIASKRKGPLIAPEPFAEASVVESSKPLVREVSVDLAATAPTPKKGKKALTVTGPCAVGKEAQVAASSVVESRERLERQELVELALSAPIPRKRKIPLGLTELSTVISKKKQVTESLAAELTVSDVLRRQISVELAVAAPIPKEPTNLTETSAFVGESKQVTEASVVESSKLLRHQTSVEMAATAPIPEKPERRKEQVMEEAVVVESNVATMGCNSDTVSRRCDSVVQSSPSRLEKSAARQNSTSHVEGTCHDEGSCPRECIGDSNGGRDCVAQPKLVTPKEKVVRNSQMKDAGKPDVSGISLNSLSIKELLGYLKKGCLEDDEAIEKLQFILKHEVEGEIKASKNDPNLRRRVRELGLIQKLLKLANMADLCMRESQSVDSWQRLQVYVTAINGLKFPSSLQPSELSASVKFVTTNGHENVLGRLPWKPYMSRISFEETPPYGVYYNPTFMAEDGKFEFRFETRKRRGHRRTYQGKFLVKLSDLSQRGTSGKDSWDLTFDSSQCGVDFSSPSACICLRVNRLESENVKEYSRKKHKVAEGRLKAIVEWVTRLNDDLEDWNIDYNDDLPPLGADIRLTGGLSLLHTAIFLKDTTQLARLLDLKQHPIDQTCLDSALSIVDAADRLDDAMVLDEMSRMLSEQIQTQTGAHKPILAASVEDTTSTHKDDSAAEVQTHPAAAAAAGGPDRPNNRPSTELTNDDSTRPNLQQSTWAPHEDRVGLGNILANRASEICDIIPCLDNRAWRHTDSTKECPSFKTRHLCRNLSCPLVHVHRMTSADIDHALTFMSMKNESLSLKMGRIHARHKFVHTKHVDVDISGVEGAAPITTIRLWTAAFEAPDEVVYAVGGENAMLSRDGVSWYRDQADSIEALAKTVVVGQRARLTEYVPRAYLRPRTGPPRDSLLAAASPATTTGMHCSNSGKDVQHAAASGAPDRPITDKQPRSELKNGDVAIIAAPSPQQPPTMTKHEDPVGVDSILSHCPSDICSIIPCLDQREWRNTSPNKECPSFKMQHMCQNWRCSFVHVHRFASRDVARAVTSMSMQNELPSKMAKIHPDCEFIHTIGVDIDIAGVAAVAAAASQVTTMRLWTAAFDTHDEVFYAVGGRNALLSRDNVSWYCDKSDAIEALSRTVVVCQRARRTLYVPRAYLNHKTGTFGHSKILAASPATSGSFINRCAIDDQHAPAETVPVCLRNAVLGCDSVEPLGGHLGDKHQQLRQLEVLNQTQMEDEFHKIICTQLLTSQHAAEICAKIPLVGDWHRKPSSQQECPLFQKYHRCANLNCSLLHVHRHTRSDVDRAINVLSLHDSLASRMNRLHPNHKFIQTMQVTVDVDSAARFVFPKASPVTTTIQLWTAAFHAPGEVIYAVGGQSVLSRDSVAWYADKGDAIQALIRVVVVAQRARASHYVPEAYFALLQH